MSEKLILVTGITGFIAGHIALQSLEKGYRVRGTVRGGKIETLRNTVKLPGLEFIQVDDVATSDLTEALKGVYAVIHTASPMVGGADARSTMQSAIDGTLNVLRQVADAGIEKVVITSSVCSVFGPSLQPTFTGVTYNESQWGETSEEAVLANKDDPIFVYFSSKILAEKAAWQFAQDHPTLDIATILPSGVFGPYAEQFPFPSVAGLGTNTLLQMLLNGEHPIHPLPFYVDVRDAAKSHILALDVPRKPLGDKRYFAHGENYNWKDAAAHLNKVRPELNIAKPDSFPEPSGSASMLDTTHTREALQSGDFIPFQKSFQDTADCLLVMQKQWAATVTS